MDNFPTNITQKCIQSKKINNVGKVLREGYGIRGYAGDKIERTTEVIWGVGER